MSKKRERPPKKVQTAPAYMAQFAALMTILLAFFILMLTMGQQKVSQFQQGSGLIKNLVDLTGGKGVLDFWRSMQQPALPSVAAATGDPDAKLIGYDADALDQFSLDPESINQIDFLDNRQILRLRSTIRFEPGRVRVDRESQFALDQALAMLYSLQQYHVVVGVMSDTGNAAADRLLAAQRAAWLVRHITENGQISRDRIRSLGLVRSLTTEDGEPVEVIFLLRNTVRNRA